MDDETYIILAFVLIALAVIAGLSIGLQASNLHDAKAYSVHTSDGVGECAKGSYFLEINNPICLSNSKKGVK